VRLDKILLQSNAILRDAAPIEFVLSTYEKQAVQRSDNIRNSLGLNFKSVALASRATGWQIAFRDE
jgi:hypothetical protein